MFQSVSWKQSYSAEVVSSGHTVICLFGEFKKWSICWNQHNRDLVQVPEVGAGCSLVRIFFCHVNQVKCVVFPCCKVHVFFLWLSGRALH